MNWFKKLFKRKEKKEVSIINEHFPLCVQCLMPIFPDQPSAVVNNKIYHKRCLRKMKRKIKAYQVSGNMKSLG